jgi:uncharacterized protein YjbI with pentapeptide repeats
MMASNDFLNLLHLGKVRGKTFLDVDLSGQSFYGRTTLWDEAILPNVNLTDANLQSTLLLNAIMKGAILDGTDLSPTGETHHLPESDWQGTNLSGAIVRNHSILDHAMFNYSKWVGAVIETTSMVHTFFNHADLRRLTIGQDIVLRDVNFGSADLRGANLSHAIVPDWSTIYLRNAIMDSQTMMPKGFKPKQHQIVWR